MLLVLKVDPHKPSLRLLTPSFADRVQAYVTEYQPLHKAEEFTAGIMARLWLGDPNTLALALLDDETGKLVGHAVATREQLGSASWVQIHQARADQNVGDARRQAVKAIIAWAESLNLGDRVLLESNREAREADKTLGFKPYRYQLRYERPSEPLAIVA